MEKKRLTTIRVNEDLLMNVKIRIAQLEKRGIKTSISKICEQALKGFLMKNEEAKEWRYEQ